MTCKSCSYPGNEPAISLKISKDYVATKDLHIGAIKAMGTAKIYTAGYKIYVHPGVDISRFRATKPVIRRPIKVLKRETFDIGPPVVPNKKDAKPAVPIVSTEEPEDNEPVSDRGGVFYPEEKEEE